MTDVLRLTAENKREALVAMKKLLAELNKIPNDSPEANNKLWCTVTKEIAISKEES